MSISGRYWLPGPVEVDSAVLASMTAPMVGHRRPEGKELAASVQNKLRKLFSTNRPVLLATCSGTAMMECAVRSGVEERMLAVVGGMFGERFAAIGEMCDREVVRVHVPRGDTLDPQLLERLLDGPPVDAVSLVHVETSTGAVAPIRELVRLLRRQWDPVILVDAIASTGGMPVTPDEWDADFVLSATQKAIAVPPGLAFAVASPRFLSRARKMEARGMYLDALALHTAAAAREFPQTPSLPIVRALDAQLDRLFDEGIEERFQRHEQLRKVVENWVESRPEISLLAPRGNRANTVSTLVLRERSASELVASIATKGWTIAVGLEDESDREIRIGHMGEVTVGQLSELLAAIDKEL